MARELIKFMYCIVLREKGNNVICALTELTQHKYPHLIRIEKDNYLKTWINTSKTEPAK